MSEALGPEFEVIEQLHIGKHSKVVRCKYKNTSVIVKTHPHPFARRNELEGLQKEYELVQLISSNSAHIVKFNSFVVKEFEDKKVAAAIIMDDCGGRSLSHVLPANGFAVPKFLEIAIQCVQGLQVIHRNNIIHKDLKPANMLLKENGEVVQIDFGCATRLHEETEQASTSLQNVYGTLAYVSPEQTGRINRTIDYRTDFYSLGVTLYQLVSGKLPFATTDVMELIHSHIAIEPPMLPSHIPHMIEAIIFKLLKKDASERYRSCQGLLHDLQRCHQTMTNVSTTDGRYQIEKFALGENDFIERFNLPKRLYGRDTEIEQLLFTFDKVAMTGETAMLLVSGYSGIGKSSLVREVQRSVQLRHGYFASGKFDQLERNIAYSAISDAFQTLIKQVLAEGEERTPKWRKRILDAVGTNGQVIIDLIPDLEKLIGKQPPVPTLGSAETQNRLDITLEKFVGALVQESPLVLFLDDLQWADRESINMVRLFLENSKYILFVGAYRNNEVTSVHPAMQMISQMRNKIYVGDIILAPLDVGVVYQWISDTLQGTVSNNTDQVHDKGEVMKLAEMIHKKTGGNPFFMKMFLLALHSEGLITREGLLWKWDLEKIKQQRATDNVVNLMTHRIDQFSGTTEEVLKWASCMGNNFDFNKLSSVMHKSKATLMGELYPVLNAGMVIMLNDRFHFAHDRVQEACYARLSERERNVIHYSIGRNWRKLILENEERTDSGKSSMDAGKDMFEVVDHLNKGVGILWDTTAVEVLKELDQRPIGQQLEEMADFNLSMGKQAQDAAAYSSAINYFKAGVACALRLCETDSESWEKHHDIVYSLHSELATTYSLTADYESANRVIDLLLTKAKDKIELSTIYTLQILQENVYSNFEKSLEIGRLALHQFGIDLPPSNDPTIPEHITQEMQLIEQRIEELRNKETGEVDLSPLLFTPDVETQCLYKIIATLLVTAYLFDPIIFPLMASISTRVVLNRCVSSTTTTMFSYFAIVLSTREAFSLVHDFSEIILQCVREQFPLDYAEKCRTMHLYNIFVHHWFYPIRELIPSCHELTVIGLESGETTYATYVYSILCPIHMLVGNDIDHVVSDVEAGLTVAHKYKNHIIRELNTQILTEYRIMQGSKYSTDQAKVDKMEKEMYESTVNEFPRVQHLIFRVMIDFIIEEDYKGPGEELMTWAKTKYQKLLDIDPKLPFIVSMYLNAIIHYYESLTLIRILRALDSKDEKDCIDLATSINLRLQKNIKQLTRWSDLCPANFLNKLVLVQAEMSAYISKDGWAAIQLYEKSVSEATKQGFQNERAVALELQAKYLYTLNAPQFADTCINNAYKSYKAWGFYRKVETMEKMYNNVLVNTSTAQQQTENQQSFYTNTNTIALSSAYFNLESVLKASQAISSAIDLDKLLANIMKIIIETAGASYGAIIIDNHVEAQYLNFVVDTVCSIPVGEWDTGCTAIVEYATKNKRLVVLGCAHEDPLLGKDPYITKNNIKSVLCMPVLHQNEVKAVLYVENNLTTDCFKSEQVKVLNILTGQVAISLENTRFFNSRLKALEELADVQRRRAEEEEDFRKKQEEFIDRICHEIRNPIQGIVGCCDIMNGALKTIEPHIPPTLQNDLVSLKSCTDSIQLCGKYQKIITDDVLTLSKLEFNKVKLMLEPMQLQTLLSSAVQMFEGDALKKGLYLNTKIAGTLPDLVFIGDYNRINQILTNLISNALKFTNKGGITISCSHQVDEKDPSCIIIRTEVHDTGMGVNPSDSDFIFNRFAQSTQRTITDYCGSGLGLFIGKMLAELMGGKIWMENNPDKGCTFYFTVRVQLANKQEAKLVRRLSENFAESGVSENEKKLEVLIVEDNKINQKVLAHMLKEFNCICTIAANGLEGYNEYVKKHYDLVFMDVAMPILNGFESTRMIRKYEEEKQQKAVPIIGLSGNVRQEHHGMVAGMTRYLNKPITRKDIRFLLTQDAIFT